MEIKAESGSGNWMIPPAFPLTVSFGETSIKLYDDGTFSGDIDAFEEAVKRTPSYGGNSALLMWMVLAIAKLQRGIK